MALVRSRSVAVLIAVLIMVVSLIRNGQPVIGHVLHADLPNPDSYYNLVAVSDGWPTHQFPLVQRDGAPYGNWLHWTLPYSWTLWQLHRPLTALGVEPRQALLWAGSALTVLSMLLLSLFVARAVSVAGTCRAAMVSGLTLATSIPLLSYGRLDQITHHVFMLVPLAAAAALLLRAGGAHACIRDALAGLLLALAWWISPEAMPFIVGLLYIRMALRLQHASTASVWPIALGLLLMTLLAYRLDPVPPTFGVWALDRMSLSYLLLGTLLASILLLADGLAAGPLALRWRVLLVLVASGFAAAIWLWQVPAVTKGPAGLLPEDLQRLWWSHISELRPVHGPANWLAWLGLPLAAGALCGYVAWRQRSLWLCGLALMALVYGLLGAWHLRMGAAAAVSSCLAYCIAAGKLRAFADDDAPPSARDQLLGFVLTLTGPVLLGGSVALNHFWPGDIDVGLHDCGMASIAGALNTLPQATILTEIFSGPELLYRTHHRTIAGPYHHNVAGLLDAYHAWRDTGADVQAQAIVRRRHIDYVLGCAQVPDNLEAPSGKQSLAQRVAAGDPPPWLRARPWPSGTQTHWRLYQVLLPTPGSYH